MTLVWMVPVLVGMAVVLQGGFNRQVSAQWGLANTVLVNGIVFLLISVALWALVKLRPGLLGAEFLPPHATGSTLALWRVILPGVFGVVIVTGLPWAIARMGALGAILIVLVTQLVLSLVWDAVVEGVPVHPARVGGALLALAGAWLAQLER